MDISCFWWRTQTDLVDDHHDLDFLHEQLSEGVVKSLHAVLNHALQLPQLCLQLLWEGITKVIITGTVKYVGTCNLIEIDVNISK